VLAIQLPAAEELAREAEARKRSGKKQESSETGRLREHLAKLVGIRPSTVKRALKLRGNEQLQDAVLSGEMKLGVAVRLSALASGDQAAAIDAVKNGDNERLMQLMDRFPCDANGVEIPEHLRPVFADKGFSSTAKGLRKLGGSLRTMTESEAGVELRKHITAKLLQQFSNIAHVVEQSVPYVVCSFCKADGDPCGTCDTRGWLTRQQHEHEVAAAYESRRQRCG
jgi:hypothetical protein